GRFPTGPVSADAVLLTTLGIEAGQRFDGLSQTLITAVVGDLVRRGVRAMEAFGRTAEVKELGVRGSVPTDVRPVMEALGDCSVD
ncbi:acetyltransferase, partial [Mycobacterium sp. ITM-2017-0098]